MCYGSFHGTGHPERSGVLSRQQVGASVCEPALRSAGRRLRRVGLGRTVPAHICPHHRFRGYQHRPDESRSDRCCPRRGSYDARRTFRAGQFACRLRGARSEIRCLVDHRQRGAYSDALECTINVAASVIAWVALRFAARPADANHPYGHDKAEFFAAVIEGVLIVVAALLIFDEAWQSLAPSAITRGATPRPRAERERDGDQRDLVGVLLRRRTRIAVARACRPMVGICWPMW